MTSLRPIRAAFTTLLLTLAGHAAAEGAWIADAKGCKVWEPFPRPNETAAWNGACVNGYGDGSGTLQWSVDGNLASTFEGRLSAGKQNGKGKDTGANGDIYEGDFADGLRQGKGTLTTKKGNHYEGDFTGGRLTGQGIYTWADGTRYSGEMNDAKPNGKGSLSLASGDHYEGDFVNGKRTGKGVYTWHAGGHYEGDFVDGRQEGKGIFVKPNGDRYEGAFVNGQFEGQGTMQYANGIRYDGAWKAGKYDGMGKVTSRTKEVVESEFKAGNRVGPSRAAESPILFDIRACAPTYPKAALDAKEAGVARVQFDVDAGGKLTAIKIAQSTGFPDLDQATLAALSHCEFKAAIKDSKPVASTLLIDYEWKPIPPKVPQIIKQLEGDQGAVLIEVIMVNVKNLDHPEQIRKEHGHYAKEIKLRNLATNKKYSAKFDTGVGILVVPEGNYCLDSFDDTIYVDRKPMDSYMHWCKGESIPVVKGLINNAGQWWFGAAEPTDDDPYHGVIKMLDVLPRSPKTLEKAVDTHPGLLED